MDEGHILTMADGEKCKNGEDSGPVGMLIEAINEIFDIPAPKVPFGSFILSATYCARICVVMLMFRLAGL